MDLLTKIMAVTESLKYIYIFFISKKTVTSVCLLVAVMKHFMYSSPPRPPVPSQQAETRWQGAMFGSSYIFLLVF